MYKIRCVPTKVVFYNPSSNYKVISCRFEDISTKPPEFKVNELYGNTFTLNGSNLDSVKVDVPIELEVREDVRAKYPASYVVVGYSAFSFSNGERIEVKEEDEYNLLCELMSESQAYNVHKAYPHFIEMVLNGEEEQIDYKKIYNVAKYRYEEYCNKVKQNFKRILYLPICSQYEIENQRLVDQVIEPYATPDDLRKALNTNPYHVLCDLGEFSFGKADKIILENNPSMIDSLNRCFFGCYYILLQNEQEGDTKLNANILARFAKEMMPECAHHIIEAVKDNPYIYYDEETKYASIKKTYEAEVNIAKHLRYRVENAVDDGYAWENFKEIEGFVCTDEQAEILKLASEKSVAILNGSAGTGKTTSVKCLIKMLDEYGKSYLLLAPTGVAAKRLKQSTGRDASTIHMFLAHQQMEEYDYIIIDEFSMVGVELFSRLLKNVGLQPKLILVCDEAQLASISCGNLIQDMVDSGIIPRANLTKVFRYGEGGIATVATDTRNGINSNRKDSVYEDYEFLPLSDAIDQVVLEYGKLLNQGYNKDNILVLCPFNKSNIGTYALNSAIQQQYNNHTGNETFIELPTKEKMKFKIGDKVINTRNNYNAKYLELNEDDGSYYECGTVPVMNGDMGYIRSIIYDKENANTKLLVEFDCGMVAFENSEISDLLLGYAISVHKSQGTQAKAVIVVLAKNHANMMSRNLLYVAESRAQEKLIEIANIECIEKALTIEENKTRDTWLKDLLKGEE